MDSADMEELSFGDDRREPESRTGLLRRPLVVAGLVVALLAGLGLAGWRFSGQSRRPLPPPAQSPPRSGFFSVYLCPNSPHDLPACHDGAATEEDRRGIEAALKAMPEVRIFRFRTREQGWEDFQEWVAPGEGSGTESVYEPADVPEAYHGALGPGDWQGVKRRLEGLPGVSDVIVFGDTAWRGRADIAIQFCPDRGDGAFERCERTPRASERERAAVLDRIEDLDGVEAVYFEDLAHALRDRRRMLWEGTEIDPLVVPEGFWLRLDRPGRLSEMREIFGRMPGVAAVLEVSAPPQWRFAVTPGAGR
ncbi:permease-like cell division protein FtsX [Microbispora sp. ZYX-F-249]|uniref:Permease-like cell division protein FtsX n=1 Tax=Microbispora maris TaxID=3144104 RepID=A0ABV0B1G7_9ACTN